MNSVISSQSLCATHCQIMPFGLTNTLYLQSQKISIVSEFCPQDSILEGKQR